ncbi:M20 family metallopeptidase [Kytococcus sedentarius]|uniref:M20 metallopeptidase family protein n=1 Tax=Kytococcus sedentarius TaxID=1276 RepID=UPI0035BC83FA
MSLVDEAQTLAPTLTALRRELHQDPEIGNHLPRTQQRVLEALDGLPLEITTGTSTTSVVAVLRGEHPGPAVILRGDMDALPVAEENDLPYRSTNGAMHACGHDLHTAGLVGAAHLLAAHRAELHGSVIFMFQPGEEGPGGAEPMLAEGLLEAAGVPVVGAYAIHVMPGPAGQFQYSIGPALAGANEVYVTMHGAGGHGSQPHLATDPVPALLDFCTQLQVAVTRRFDVFDPAVVSVTQLSAGDAVNVIPPSASMGATIRTLSAESLERIQQVTRQLADAVATAHGCTAEHDFQVHYPVTLNEADQTRQAVGWLTELLGPDAIAERQTPIMGSEDFSFVANEVPGTFLFLGASPEGVDPETAAYNHSPLVLFDDAVLPRQSAALAHLALQRLGADGVSPTPGAAPTTGVNTPGAAPTTAGDADRIEEN